MRRRRIFAARMLPKLIFSGNIVTVVSILLAALVYVIMLSLLRVVEREDIYSLPNGKKNCKSTCKIQNNKVVYMQCLK